MSVSFFRKLVASICAVVCVGSIFLGLLVKAKTQEKACTIYFVTTSTASVEASAGIISLQGGAGYPMEDGVAFGVYFSMSAAEVAVNGVREVYPNASVQNRSIFFSETDRSRKILYTALTHVQEWIKVLEMGARQSVVKAGLAEIASLLNRVGVEHADELLISISEELQRLSIKTVFANDLRYFLCWSCEGLQGKGLLKN